MVDEKSAKFANSLRSLLAGKYVDTEEMSDEEVFDEARKIYDGGVDYVLARIKSGPA